MFMTPDWEKCSYILWRFKSCITKSPPTSWYFLYYCSKGCPVVGCDLSIILVDCQMNGPQVPNKGDYIGRHWKHHTGVNELHTVRRQSSPLITLHSTPMTKSSMGTETRWHMFTLTVKGNERTCWGGWMDLNCLTCAVLKVMVSAWCFHPSTVRYWKYHLHTHPAFSLQETQRLPYLLQGFQHKHWHGLRDTEDVQRNLNEENKHGKMSFELKTTPVQLKISL